VKRLLCTATAVQSVNCDRAVVKFKHENKPKFFSRRSYVRLRYKEPERTDFEADPERKLPMKMKMNYRNDAEKIENQISNARENVRRSQANNCDQDRQLGKEKLFLFSPTNSNY
jgi:hypothetical protein